MGIVDHDSERSFHFNWLESSGCAGGGGQPGRDPVGSYSKGKRSSRRAERVLQVVSSRKVKPDRRLILRRDQIKIGFPAGIFDIAGPHHCFLSHPESGGAVREFL